jgi:exosome complex component RRP46
MLLNESDGVFSYEEWDDAAEGMEVDGKEGSNLDQWLREVVREKVAKEQRWKTAR